MSLSRLSLTLVVALSFNALASGSTAPATAPASAVAPTPVIVARGGEKVLTVAALSRVAIGDPAVADVSVSGTDTLVIKGVSSGQTTLLVWAGKNRLEYAITVR
jgi:pilus assembly protein CpaC